MALTPFQRDTIRLLARRRITGGESYVAGGAALNELLQSPRVSADLDLFHDSQSALDGSVAADTTELLTAGYQVQVIRERPAFVEANVSRSAENVLLRWVRDSTFRFFPLMAHDELGLTLHPFDLATNKVLALVGRMEPRDWVDTIECHRKLQPLGYLAWAACGKDPGFSPEAVIEHAARHHYSTPEIASLSFEGAPPDAAELSRKWREILTGGREIVDALPSDQCGKCVLTRTGQLFTASGLELRAALASGGVMFHEGRIGGALPEVVGSSRATPT